MIIKEVKLSRGFPFFKEEVFVFTNERKFSLDEKWNKDLVEDLNSKLKNFKIKSSEDFSNLKNTLRNLGNEKYKILEKKISKNIKQFWKFFDPSVTQIPRPLYVVLEKNIGAREFVVFSLNAKDFDAVFNSCKRIKDFINKNISDVNKSKEEDLLMLLKEAIDAEHELVNFELRVGVVFNNFDKGFYNYVGTNLNPSEQLDFLSKLIEKYGVVYVENPFDEMDLSNYKKLTNKYKSLCLVCLNSKINEYNRGVSEGMFNTSLVKFNDIADFRSEVLHLKDNSINIIAEQSDFIDAVVGLKISLVKLYDNNIGNSTAERLREIIKEIEQAKN